MNKKRVPQAPSRYETYDTAPGWSTADKRLLLQGLKKYGHKDIENLVEMVPNKSAAAIKTMISNTMLAARRETKTGKLSPIDMWLSLTSMDDTNALIPQALYFISLFEKQPIPAHCNNCDLRAAYDFIYRMTHNYPPVELPQKTRRTVYKIISKTVSRMRIRSSGSLLQIINMYKCTLHKDYSHKPRRNKAVGVYKVLESLNTFMVPSDQLRLVI